MHEFVREQPAASQRLRRKLSGTEQDVAPDRECSRADALG
jgi:hypothetical protein